MRNFNVITDGLEEDSPKNDVKCIYKEVVVVGNGPSGITLSYLLNGYRPYYNKIPHPDPMLSARLVECTHKSLLQQDLSFLSQGIEGRSKNPISLLIDAMTHPGADMGLEWPSLLTWKKTAKSLDHIVLGKGEPGGTWPAIADHVLTISPGRWMALPGFDFKEYHDKRAPAVEVAKYYVEYVKKHELTPYMASQSTVTMMQPLVSKFRKRARWKVWVTDANGSMVTYECRHLVLATGSSDKAGCLRVPGEAFSYVTHNLRHFEELLLRRKEKYLYVTPVMTSSGGKEHAEATTDVQTPAEISGSPFRNGDCQNEREEDEEEEASNGWGEEKSEREGAVNGRNAESEGYAYELTKSQSGVKAFPNEDEVWVEGEGVSSQQEMNFGKLDLDEKEFEKAEEEEETVIKEKSRVLIVGAGLSAADAILAAWRKNCLVVHAFRNPLTSTKLPAVMYPEYHELYRLMQGLDSRKDYHPLPGHQVTEFLRDNTVELADSTGARKRIKVLAAAVLIGSHPDLSFLPKTQKNLGVDPSKPVDCKVNPIQIDPFSHRCVRAPPGLYALGPLVGDNFVRFLQGGAVAVAGHIVKDSNFHKNLN